LLPYGSNTAQCMTESSQRFLLATKGTLPVGESSNSLMNYPQPAFPNLLTSDFCSSKYDRKLSASYVPHLFRKSF